MRTQCDLRYQLWEIDLSEARKTYGGGATMVAGTPILSLSPIFARGTFARNTPDTRGALLNNDEATRRINLKHGRDRKDKTAQ